MAQILRCAMLYPWPGVGKSVCSIIYSFAKTYSFIYSNKHSQLQRIKKITRKKSTFNATKYVDNLSQYFSNFFHLSLGYCQFRLRIFQKYLPTDLFLLMYKTITIKSYWKLLMIPNQKEVPYSYLWKKGEYFCY